MAPRRLPGAGDARAGSRRMTRGLPGEESGQCSRSGTDEGGREHNVNKPGVGSHWWFRVMGAGFDGGRELSADRQAERDLGGPSST